jgi:hypothetical protein
MVSASSLSVPSKGSGTWGPTAPITQPTVTAEQSTQIAQQWLDQNQAAAATEAPVSFPGYYTIHVIRDGRVNGMLSVNAYTGQLRVHTWRAHCYSTWAKTLNGRPAMMSAHGICHLARSARKRTICRGTARSC